MSNVNETDMPVEEFCKMNPLSDKLLWINPASYTTMYQICHKVNGFLPVLTTSDRSSPEFQRIKQ